MARYPDALFTPLVADPDVHPPAMARYDLVVVHTMVGSLAGTDDLFRRANGKGYDGTESHFGLGHDGTVVQWVDTRWRAESQVDANHRAISIECADVGSGFPVWDTDGSDVPDFTSAQVEALVDLIAWICRTHDIPRTVVPDSRSSRRGLGWHRLGVESNPEHQPGYRQPGGELWSTRRGKVCPGDRRIATLRTTVFPRVAGHHPNTVPAPPPVVAPLVTPDAATVKHPTWKQLWAVISRQFPTLRRTDDARDNDTDFHGRAGVNDFCAIDIAGPLPDPDGNDLTREVTRWIATTYPGSTELIHTPAGPEFQLKNGRRHVYSPDVQDEHHDHIHWAYDLAVLPVPEEDDMPYRDWPQADRDALTQDIANTFSADVFGAPAGTRDHLTDTMHRVTRIELTLGDLKETLDRSRAGIAALLAQPPRQELSDDELSRIVAALRAALPPATARRLGDQLQEVQNLPA